ncbi:DUF982 domain-containing protein [Mesorhizobium sp. AR10]|uniref:DUF982 domain-containing protein n=1 Tax=Mesorhizobium sp. AR10 TaxID=2865839 RepID=UPI00215F4D6E|nr:DUF982 domain-containing protein [Mesorhizobium sp. AR10]UVK37824.1 DUF982 domain-containing protein [Mesorhizobium sp. AR10]
MDEMLFHAPVAIAVGAGFKRDIASLAQMQNFLKEWPPARRGPIHATALRACDAARAGHLTTDQARRAFMSFAEAAGILWTGVDPVTALREAKAARNARAMQATTAPDDSSAVAKPFV